MPRRKTALEAGYYYHIYNRGNNGDLIFIEPENYGYFIKLIRKYFIESLVEMVSYCLMPNHYHFLVYLKDRDFSDCMKKLSLAYVKAINQRYQRSGSLFEGRFQSIVIDNDRYLCHLSRYIHINPVRANLVKHPQDWIFSSYRDYVGLRRGTLPKPDVVLSQFSGREDYRQFVESEVDERIIQRLILE
ncbi:transposase [Baaleninema sp.]|uniref:transposase n=1 Tax=Baaleninema sp. TaxID=3101197 RepID=UPI003D07E96C